MRTTIIPAQITTVEDKIAGSLNFAQILLFMAPVLWGTLVYTLFMPSMKIALYKIGVVLIVAIICLVMAIRIKDKIIAEWAMVLLKYKLRPKLYLFDKNDLTERTVDVPFVELVKNLTKVPAPSQKKQQREMTIAERIRLEQALSSRKLAVSFRFGGKR